MTPRIPRDWLGVDPEEPGSVTEALVSFRQIQLTQSDRGVPSSANWKPTNPLINRHVYVAATSPV